ncbi:uncharacterized protein LOC110901972 [Helianthus annuus]|uniref:uncharacterized protein LOC110901972 n=1 Tax=Helianthus annuus TaxID=4232 RepID=UPI000B8EF735|nr:uncharacterized protein LOC110901972 [Helianthus annuus]
MQSNSWWSSSSEEEEMFYANIVLRATKKRKRSRPKGVHKKLVNDYFSDAPFYNAKIFRRRFRMSRRLFTCIADDLAGEDPFFTQRYDARGYEGFTTLQKCTAAIRQLAYGTVVDALDEYLQMSERTTRECLYRFCENVVQLYSKKYLRKPNAYDVQQLYQAHEARHGFPGMLRSIDCMHWAWYNYPNTRRGQYTRGDHGHPTFILEAVASQDLWIWHTFFGLPGSLNNLNVIYQSATFSDVVNGTGPDTSFSVSWVEYRRDYYLADGIYLSYSTIVKTIPYPEDEKRKNLPRVKKRQEKTSNVVLVFDNKNGPSVNNRHVRSHRRDEGRAICEYNENTSIGNTVPVDPAQQDLNSFSLTNDFTYANHQTNLVEHIWNNANDGDGDEDDNE